MDRRPPAGSLAIFKNLALLAVATSSLTPSWPAMLAWLSPRTEFSDAYPGESRVFGFGHEYVNVG
jgi:hypothetical protein